MADHPPVPTSPSIIRFVDTAELAMQVTINFDNTTLLLTGVTVVRDANCAFTKLLIGLGTDGVPDSTDKVFNIPAGTTNITPGQLAARGLNTITDVNQYQITAGR